ncbi:hypothetical protein [Labrys neptuniae]
MGRLVRPAPLPRQSGGLEGVLESGADEAPEQGGDNYLQRVAKYIPAEIIAFCIFANGILKQAMTSAGKDEALMAGFRVQSIGLAIFLLAWILTPVYLWRLRQPGDGWKTNAALAFALFPVWNYATEGVGLTAYLKFDGNFASILLGTATLISGLVQPPQPTAGEDAPASGGGQG